MTTRDMLRSPMWALLDSPVIVGDCVEVLASLPGDSIDAVVCDPPYGIGFMGHEWDQPGDFGPVRSMGTPGPYASGRPQDGPHVAGRAERMKRLGNKRVRVSQPAATGFGAPGKRFGGPSGVDNTTHSARGGDARRPLRPQRVG